VQSFARENPEVEEMDGYEALRIALVEFNSKPVTPDPIESVSVSSDQATPQRMVREFHEAFELPIGSEPSLTAATTNALRLALIDEEVGELHEAVAKGDLIAVADALADITYVVYGAADTWGFDLDAVIREVHRSNMTKLGDDGKAIRREDGKVLKGKNYDPPRIAEILGL
jgi:predicted HAD superfamily Cof-like phosphohydrolase